ncbi:MAG: hypothetical protein GX300_01920 [Tissierellia bacterium]|nr:hypothetical protein [Tissierellia bacterium]
MLVIATDSIWLEHHYIADRWVGGLMHNGNHGLKKNIYILLMGNCFENQI